MIESKPIIIVDYGAGNIKSVVKKVEMLGFKAIVTNDYDLIVNANKLILPGVGHFENAMHQLKELNLIEALTIAVCEKKVPILGICLGLQLMTMHSEEGNCAGLGWLDAKVVRFNVSDKHKFKVPHIGWNTIQINKESKLLQGIESNSEFYFVHSYHVQTDNDTIILNTTNYSYDFVSALEKDNIYGVQYHPEKSHDIGAKMINNFLSL
jgi:glutamine amidotransferase